MDISFLGGPPLQRGVGIVAPFDFALDRELWRWVPDHVSLHLTRTPFVPVEVSLSMARLVSEHSTLHDGVQALMAVRPETVAYACTSGSFVGGLAGERAMCGAMTEAGAPATCTTSGALLDALRELKVRRLAVVTPYTRSVTDALEDYLAEDGIIVTGREYMGLTGEIWRVPYRDVVALARRALPLDGTGADALFISCTNLPTYDVIPQLEAELRVPVLSANQVTMWAALRQLGELAVGPFQKLLIHEKQVREQRQPVWPGPVATVFTDSVIPTTVLSGADLPEVLRPEVLGPEVLGPEPIRPESLRTESARPEPALAGAEELLSDSQNVNNPQADPYTGEQ